MVGITLSVTLFIAQGPYQSWINYVAGLSPAVAAIAGVAGLRAYRKYKELRHALVLATGARQSVTTVIRIQNSVGDVVIDRRFRLSVLAKAARVQYTPEEGVIVGLGVPMTPPVPKVIASRRAGRRLVVKAGFSHQLNLEGDAALEYGWSYRIEPPLEGKGDYMEYAHQLQFARECARAFDPGGDTFVCENVVYGSNTESVLVGPPGHRFVVVDAWLIDFDGTRVELGAADRPSVSASGHQLAWSPQWRKGARHICRFRLIPVATA